VKQEVVQGTQERDLLRRAAASLTFGYDSPTEFEAMAAVA
jgi:hypothetical protein